jgi:predicted transcriptional regulator
MTEKRHGKDRAKHGRQPRASITFPPRLYRTLESLAKEKKVSIAWVVREAAEKYVTDQSFQSDKIKGSSL